MLFQFANAPMLPLVGSFMTSQSAANPGRHYRDYNPRHGTRPQLWARPCSLQPARSYFAGCYLHSCAIRILLVVIQVLDGMSAAVLSVLIPSVAWTSPVDPATSTAQGFVGTATGLGDSISMVFAGFLSGRFATKSRFCR